MTSPTTVTTDGQQAVDDAITLLDSIKTGDWIPRGLKGNGSLTALSSQMRPIDRLSSAGLGWLVPYVQPLQTVLDQLAGQAGVIQSYSDAWQQASTKIDDVRSRLTALAAGDTSGWGGGAADEYRKRTREITFALDAATRVSEATSLITRQMGALIADARQQIYDLVTQLVDQLISYVQQATAAHGGQVTPDVLSNATRLIDSYRPKIDAIVQRLQQVMDDIQPPTTPAPPGPSTGEKIGDAVVTVIGSLPWGRFGKAWSAIRAILRRRGGSPPPPSPQQPRPSQEVTESQMVNAIRNSPTTQIGRVNPPAHWPPTTTAGYDMQSQIDQMVRQRWPGVQFANTRRGAGGPDMPVTSRDPGAPDPGFDWVEIKPNTDSGINAFVRNEWGTTPAWSGRGRLVTYDQRGNVFEIDFPAH
ncbi:MAG TPA: hypothetical protein VH333_10630 [Pseudonocardiaceae bacterium]|jgi:uncharacterized protein YukE|nr:hypothetical protein [Pseudonocardiaceae bacterium]